MNLVPGSIKKYLSLIKFSHTVFALPFALIGFTLAIKTGEAEFSLKILILVILCMVFARSAAMSFNRYADRRFDALNPRTSSREIPAGTVSTRAAAIFIVINSALFILCAGFINMLTLCLSPIALIIILGYSLTKRFTSLCHFILGLGLSLAPIGAYISLTGSFNIIPLVFSAIVLTWVSGFDIIYSLQDDEFDRDNKLLSIPALAGRKNALLISSLVHLITFILLIIAGILLRGGILYWTGSIIFSGLLAYQHFIVSHQDISKVNLAFASTNGIASVVYAIFVISDFLITL